MQTTTLYDQDFHAWAEQQAEFLRTGQLERLDIENLLEEIESLGKQQRQELRNRLGVLLGHLLKWQYQPDGRSKGWFYTIREQRERVAELLADNPSLKPYLAEAIQRGYRDGLNLVGKETPIDPEALPQVCAWSEFEILAEPMEWD